MKIIGFSGKKQSGKDTAANCIYTQVDDCWIQRFADPLKNIVCDCFGATLQDCWESDKTAILECGKSVREVLQLVGTDWFRSLDKDCWVNAYRHELLRFIHSETTLILTPDVRFPNEVNCIQKTGGHVIRLLRAPFPDDTHESETALDRTEYETQFRDGLIDRKGYTKKFAEEQTKPIDIKRPVYFDAIIDNREMTIEQQNEAVWKLVNEKGWL